jgi:hypothetical protein
MTSIITIMYIMYLFSRYNNYIHYAYAFLLLKLCSLFLAEIGIDDSKICPLQSVYDAEIHDAGANMRRLDGTIPVHSKYGALVNFFTPVGIRKYWVKSSTPVLGYMLWYIIPFMYFMLFIFLPVEGFFSFTP